MGSLWLVYGWFLCFVPLDFKPHLMHKKPVLPSFDFGFGFGFIDCKQAYQFN
jgi:hypothetical protein